MVGKEGLLPAGKVLIFVELARPLIVICALHLSRYEKESRNPCGYALIRVFCLCVFSL